MHMTRFRPVLLAAGLAAAAALAGCSGSKPEEQPTDNVINESVGTMEPMPTVNETPSAPLNIGAVANTATPAPTNEASATPFGTPDSQTYDDADATGMTAKLPQDSPTPSQTEPAEQK